MMIIAKRRYIRPNSSTLWHFEALRDEPLLQNFVIETQNNVDGLLNHTFDLIDENTIEFSQIWENRDKLEKYLQDERFHEYWALKDSYNNSAGITNGEIIIDELL